jgi:hypothetical protein
MACFECYAMYKLDGANEFLAYTLLTLNFIKIYLIDLRLNFQANGLTGTISSLLFLPFIHFVQRLDNEIKLYT